jgi:hypothetical protein
VTYEELCKKKLRGEQTFTHEGKTFKGFVCHGCQSCWDLDDNDNIVEYYPHFLSPLEETKDPTI